MSRHRGAKHRRRYELWRYQPVIPEYLYPLSDGPSIQNHRITMTPAPARAVTLAVAGLCHCTNLLMSDQITNLRAPPLL